MKSYIQLFLTSIRAKSTTGGKSSVVVVFTSTEPQEGVSYVVNSFAMELAQRTRQRVLVADAEDLQKADIFDQNMATEYCQQVDLPNLYLLLSDEEIKVERGNGKQIQIRTEQTKLERGLKNLQTLRMSFDFILIDCSALSDSGDAALLAPSANGVILVVEANRIRREQVKNSMKTINMVNGNFLGCVMNKRRYPIPNWLYHRI
jgi:Mrp family chromosome partitioning ATPase